MKLWSVKRAPLIEKRLEDPHALFRKYVRLYRPEWTLTWRDCVSPSIQSGVPVVREEDTEFNKGVAVKYIEELAAKLPELQVSVQGVLKYLATKPEKLLTYTAKTSPGYPRKHRPGIVTGFTRQNGKQ